MSEIALAVRMLIAIVFLTAAVGKLRHPLAFQGVVANYRLLPEFAVPAVALLLPPLEVAVSVALLFAPAPWPELAAGLLLLLFAGAMAINIRRGRRHIDCGCFQSALKQTLNWLLVARNIVLTALLAAPVMVTQGALSAGSVADALLTGLVLFALLQSLTILWSVVPAWQPRHAVSMGAKK